MCLGIPGEVLAIDRPEARVDFGGAEKWVRIDVVGDDLAVGDYVLNHAGFAIRKIPEAQVERTVELYEEAAGGGRRNGQPRGATDGTTGAGRSPTADGAGAGGDGDGGADRGRSPGREDGRAADDD
jgi:hydrogenase expression/formation protein HypC